MSPILSVRDLSVTFDVRKQGVWPWTPSQKLHAVSQMSFDLMPGECLGVVGESGSGKSTLARAIVGTVPSSNGNILFEGADLANMDPPPTARSPPRCADDFPRPVGGA